MRYYEIETIEKARAVGSRLNLKSDESIAHMYRRWSDMKASAGWLSPLAGHISEFVTWATTAPCDEYEDAK